MLARVLLASLAVVVAGCTSLSESECRTSDWEQIGYEDGTSGAPPERVAGHGETCREHGAAVDEAAWKKGYLRGIEEYCAPEHAIQVGLRGSTYQGVCPGELDMEFQSNWRAGRIVHDQRKRVESLLDRRSQLEYSYRSAMNDQQRYEIRSELQQVDEWLRTERMRLDQAEAQLRQYQRGVK